MTAFDVSPVQTPAMNVTQSHLNDAGPDQGAKSAAAPRKRRRRTAATGAADDCFACCKRQAKCDRKRPYCGQCLEMGKDCSGYKTTLTWGVGVASRGKLRGLSSPVAEKATGGDAAVVRKTSVGQRRKSSVSKLAVDSIKLNTTLQSPTVQSGSNASSSLASPVIFRQQDFWQPSRQYPGSGSLPQPIMEDQCVTSYDDVGPTDSANTLQDNQTVLYGGTSPTFVNHFNQDLMDHGGYNDYAQGSSMFPGSAHSLSSGSDIATEEGFNQFPDPFFASAYDPNITGYDDYNHDNNQYNGADLHPRGSQQIMNLKPDLSFSIPRALSPSQFSHLPIRMQYLLDYYDKNICSVLVAFDDSINPYRSYILQLASRSEGLQSALAALSLNNMRMRRHKRPSPRGFIEQGPHDRPSSEDKRSLFQPTPEEIYYKSMSIGKLQAQLTDFSSAQDDSILAILLILCLFHVCDSGFSKFKTQLEGVQRLLSMRDPSVRTGFIGWVEMFFAWFDVMTSTVNDRETEIQGDRLDMLHYSSNLGALEQFSGCDGRLFKLIARLGRLNLLSQNRPVRADGGVYQAPVAPPKAAYQSSNGWRTRTMFDPVDYTKLDGNGWGSLSTATDEGDSSSPQEGYRDPADTRHEFWTEWQDIRSRLESWSMDDVSEDPLSPSAGGPSPAHRDLVHINESFRSSAVLYTERLANPFLPSSSPKFQRHVHTALSHISALEITSCVNKFLLWPLFIAGTECVDPKDQALVRDRCIEIQVESGFFNNISVLGVLEKVWAENLENRETEEILRRTDSLWSKGERVQAFRWRKAMDRVDGEYIVV